jgi:hypothetical protein
VWLQLQFEGKPCFGVFMAAMGTWGSRRMPVRLAHY